MAAASEAGSVLVGDFTVALTTCEYMCQAYTSFCCLAKEVRLSTAATAVLQYIILLDAPSFCVV